jgi:hypothetical protein
MLRNTLSINQRSIRRDLLTRAVTGQPRFTLPLNAMAVRGYHEKVSSVSC